MNAEEIRNTFGWNAVYSTGTSGFLDNDSQKLLRLAIIAIGELAAQLAEKSEKGEG